MKKYNRVFVVVMDSLGIGAMPDAENSEMRARTRLGISQRQSNTSTFRPCSALEWRT